MKPIDPRPSTLAADLAGCLLVGAVWLLFLILL
jgi:hypothetical protein